MNDATHLVGFPLLVEHFPINSRPTKSSHDVGGDGEADGGGDGGGDGTGDGGGDGSGDTVDSSH